MKKVWAGAWRVVHHHSLPDWLKDNDFLHSGHRPPTNSFVVCFKSIFRIHTETGNIWTHLLGEESLMLILIIQTNSLYSKELNSFEIFKPELLFDNRIMLFINMVFVNKYLHQQIKNIYPYKYRNQIFLYIIVYIRCSHYSVFYRYDSLYGCGRILCHTPHCGDTVARKSGVLCLLHWGYIVSGFLLAVSHCVLSLRESWKTI